MGKVSQGLVGSLLDGVHEAVSRIHLPLMSSKSPICCFTSLFPSSSHVPPDSVLWMGQKINEPLWKHLHSWGSWKIIHVLFALQENSQAKIPLGPKLCCLGGTVMWIKSKYYSYPLQCIQIRICFLLQQCGRTSPLEIWTSTKALPSP